MTKSVRVWEVSSTFAKRVQWGVSLDCAAGTVVLGYLWSRAEAEAHALKFKG